MPKSQALAISGTGSIAGITSHGKYFQHGGGRIRETREQHSPTL